MILLTILALTLIFLLLFMLFAVSLLGASGVIVFGDVVVCVFIIIWIIKLLTKKKGKDE